VSGIVTQADLCAPWAEIVTLGWRGGWPCPGEQTLRDGAGEPVGLVECTCTCHLPDAAGHRLPPLADRTAVHPTDVLAEGPHGNEHRRTFYGGGG
jgi:hypothetical protein